ncbi:MAG: RsmG family class I SAM-dependent methyltransferase [Acidimicrobiales bacterium]
MATAGRTVVRVEPSAWKPGSFLDLGSGGGLPGLVLAHHWAQCASVLLDSNERRVDALRQCVRQCGWEERVRVVHARAEVAARDPELRGALDVVVARSFGPPAVAAECAAPFLRVGGLLVVSEPPGLSVTPGRSISQSLSVSSDPPKQEKEDGRGQKPERWPVEPLRALGLEPLGPWRGEFGYQVLAQVEPCPERYPRREGVPAKRPLY